jgi:enoyl-CoA hydratase/carnithine racemase
VVRPVSKSVVVLERRGPVGIVTINRPHALNAVDVETTKGMTSALDTLETDDSIQVVVITGAGRRAFCAGRDLHGPPPSARGHGAASSDMGFAGVTKRRYPKILIAAVNGLAYGGGLELCLACDLIVAEEQAQFALPEVKRGLIPGSGVLRLPRRVPAMLANEIVLLGEPIDASRAFAAGLVNRLVKEGHALEEAIRLGAQVAQNAPLAIRIAKDMLRASTDYGEDVLGPQGVNALRTLFLTEDASEGVHAFREKRAPQWGAR